MLRVTPPVAADLPSASDALPALRRPDGLSERGARRLHGKLTVDERVPLSTFHSHPVRSCRRHDWTRDGFSTAP